MESFGCNNCTYLKGKQGKRCALWEVKVSEPENQSCDSGHNGNYQRRDVKPVNK